ncbi:hypothetical protein AB996_1213 [Lactococcus cremoris]|uniref:Uncharacterized protein n=1 Tax=Lactococcus lactis subsp. cremoris TaxID=1359 RepID=A0A166JN47_LACLC|nr:hypothetical protein AB996_1213 [Lactococcus cremoris]
MKTKLKILKVGRPNQIMNSLVSEQMVKIGKIIFLVAILKYFQM